MALLLCTYSVFSTAHQHTSPLFHYFIWFSSLQGTLEAEEKFFIKKNSNFGKELLKFSDIQIFLVHLNILGLLTLHVPSWY